MTSEFVPCRPQDIEPGDVLYVSENIITALLRKEGRGLWFSAPSPNGQIRLEFTPGSPFVWSQGERAFMSVEDANVRLRIPKGMVSVCRGAAVAASDVFKDALPTRDVNPIGSERIREIMDGNSRLFLRLRAVYIHEFGRDPVGAMRMLLLSLQDQSRDVRAVLLTNILSSVILDQIESAERRAREDVFAQLMVYSEAGSDPGSGKAEPEPLW
jgi:hypothetical protein